MCWQHNDRPCYRQFNSKVCPRVSVQVRLALINPHYIMGILSGHEIVNRSKECRIILIRTVEAMFDLRLKVSDHMLEAYHPDTNTWLDMPPHAEPPQQLWHPCDG